MRTDEQKRSFVDNGGRRGTSTRERAEIGLAVIAASLLAGLLLTPARWHGAVAAGTGCALLGGGLLLFGQRRSGDGGLLRRLGARARGRLFAVQVERWLHDR
jgi:hypothetical protein